MDTKEYQTVILAGLLHDIGKFLQRGDSGLGFKIEGRHPEISARFIGVFQNLFSEVADVSLLQELTQHHHEDTRLPRHILVQSLTDKHVRTLAHLVSQADNLSSAERGEKAEDYQDYKATPLAPVFGRIALDQDENLTSLRYHPKPLGDPTSLDAIFPQEFSEYLPGAMNEALKVFGDEFNKLASKLNNADFNCLMAHLMGIFQKNTWCIPSNTQEEYPDVSLYDHLKTTAAIAACLYRYHISGGTLDEKAVKDDANKFTLVVGDLSGIQNYIFDISHSGHSGVARRLRARSLFVQLLTETASHKLLHALDLPMTNILMSSGGKFYLLAPNVAEAKEKIATVRDEIDRWLLEELHGEIALNLAEVDFGHSGFKRFGGIVRDANTELQRVKLQTMRPVLQNGDKWNEDDFLRGKIDYGTDKPCEACHKMPKTNGELCRRCAMDDELGRKLPRARYIAFYDKKADGEFDIYGYSVALHTDEERSFKSCPYLIWKLNTGEVGDLTAWPAVPRYLANHIPEMGTVDCENCGMANRCSDKEERSPEAPATFNCLAYNSKGRPLLGFLKADVDNLGKIFAFGLKRDGDENKQYDTVSRLATMSRMLDLFFNGWLEHLTNTKEFEHCYTVFSGGDDLFFVGPWREILNLAREIRKDFNSYTGNLEMTLSATVFINAHRYPISRAAKEAEENLDTAKKREGKDGLQVMGHTLSWGEWDFVYGEWEKLAQSGESISSGFLYNLLRYARMWEDYKLYAESDGEKGDVLGLRFQPLLAYDIARNLDPKKTPVLHRWAEGLLDMPPKAEARHVLDNLELIASLVIFSRRGGKES